MNITAIVKIQQPSTTHNGVESGQILLLIPPQNLAEAKLGSVYYNVSCYQPEDSQSSQRPACKNILLPVSTTEYVITGLNVTK